MPLFPLQVLNPLPSGGVELVSEGALIRATTGPAVPAAGAAPGADFLWTPTIPGQTGPLAFTSFLDALNAAGALFGTKTSITLLNPGGAPVALAPGNYPIPANCTLLSTANEPGDEAIVQFGDGAYLTGPQFFRNIEDVELRSTKTLADNLPVWSSPGTGVELQGVRISGDEGGLFGSAAISPTPFALIRAGDELQVVYYEDSVLGLGGPAAVFGVQAGASLTLLMCGLSRAGAGAVVNAGTVQASFCDGATADAGSFVGGGVTNLNTFRRRVPTAVIDNVAAAGGSAIAPASWNGIAFTALPHQPVVKFSGSINVFDSVGEQVTMRILVDGVPVASKTTFVGAVANTLWEIAFDTKEFPVAPGPHTCGVDIVGANAGANANSFCTLILEQ